MTITVMGTLKPCPICKHDSWKYLHDNDCGDWEEEVYKCAHCGHVIYVELPD